MLVANILDPIQHELDPTVWDVPKEAYPVLKPQHKHWITENVIHTLESNGYHNSEAWLDLFLTGSLTTYQYSEHSDCDISLFVNTEAFPDAFPI
jgi:hypothetical protein